MFMFLFLMMTMMMMMMMTMMTMILNGRNTTELPSAVVLLFPRTQTIYLPASSLAERSDLIVVFFPFLPFSSFWFRCSCSFFFFFFFFSSLLLHLLAFVGTDFAINIAG